MATGMDHLVRTLGSFLGRRTLADILWAHFLVYANTLLLFPCPLYRRHHNAHMNAQHYLPLGSHLLLRHTQRHAPSPIPQPDHTWVLLMLPFRLLLPGLSPEGPAL